MTFGTGWAVEETCPAPAIAMATGGGFLAVFVIAGLGPQTSGCATLYPAVAV